jgi:hypothetical protein
MRFSVRVARMQARRAFRARFCSGVEHFVCERIKCPLNFALHRFVVPVLIRRVMAVVTGVVSSMVSSYVFAPCIPLSRYPDTLEAGGIAEESLG